MIADLTPRQREVLVYKANGYTNDRIAREMNIKRNTVDGLLTRTYLKLGAENAAHAVAIALAIGEIGVHQVTVLEPEKKAA